MPGESHGQKSLAGYSLWDCKESDTTEQLTLSHSFFYEGFPGGSAVKNLPAMQEMQEIRLPFLGQEDPLEEKMATYSSVLARTIP